MPWGSWINDLPTGFFLVVHIAAFALGAGFAWLAFKRELALLGAGVLAVRRRRARLHDLPPRLDRLPVRAHDRRGARPGRVRAGVRGRRLATVRRAGRSRRAGDDAERSSSPPPQLAASSSRRAAAATGRAAAPVATTEVTMAKSYRFEPEGDRDRGGRRRSPGRTRTTSRTRSRSTARTTTRSAAATASRSRSTSPAPTTTSARCTASDMDGTVIVK